MFNKNETNELYYDKFHFTVAYQTNDNSFGLEDHTLGVIVQKNTPFEKELTKEFAYKKLIEEIQAIEETSGFKNISHIYRGCVREKSVQNTIVDPCVKSSLESQL